MYYYCLILLQFSYFIKNYVHAKQELFGNENSDHKIGLWSGNCGLELAEVCRSNPNGLDMIVIEALQVFLLNKGNTFQLKMLDMGAKYSRPFPHQYRFIKGKDKGAGYGDYFDVSEMEGTLKACRDKKIKMMVQMSLVGLTRLRKRQVILLAMMLWNSFFEGNVDRPFGSEFIFDGINFVYDKNSEDVALEVIKGLKRTALMTESETNLVISSGSRDKYISTGIANESTFIIVPESFNPKNMPTGNPFVVQQSSIAMGEKIKIHEKFKSNSMFKGISCKLGSNDRFFALKRLLSRNPSTSSEDRSNNGILVYVIIIVIVVTIVTFIAYSVYKYNFIYENKNPTKLDIDISK